MNIQDLRTLVDYNYWARDRALDAAGRLTPEQLTADLANSFPSIRDTLVHIYGAEIIWCARWHGESPASLPDTAPFTDVDSIRRLWAQHEQQVRGTLESRGEAGVLELVTYRGFNGQLQAQPFWQTLQHLVNHGTYHRGQVTTLMRQLKVDPPPSTDLIAFYRQQAATR